MRFELYNAIGLRQQVRDAIARDDMREVCRLNRLADKAYALLNDVDGSIYGAWAFDRIAVTVLEGGEHAPHGFAQFVFGNAARGVQ
jgi:hypothetical protein